MNRTIKIIKKILRWAVFLIIGLVLTLLIAVEAVDRYFSSERGTRWLFSDIPQDNLSIHFTPSGVRYLSIGDASKPALLLIHGAPGSCMDWLGFASREKIYEKYRLLIVERPGYGGSKPRGAEVSVKKQAEKIAEVLEGESQKAIAMGHSYGGPIAVILGALYPDRLTEVVGLSGQYDPDNEIIFSISHFIRFRIFKYLLPRMIWVSNEEKLNHPDALRSIEPLYGEVVVPTTLIHGNKDSLVPYENSPYLMKRLKSEKKLITLEGEDHPIQMNSVDYLVNFAYQMDKVPLPDEMDTQISK